MTPFLETDRVLLRQFEDSDAAEFVKLDSDPEVIKFTGDEPLSLEQAQAWIEGTRKRFYLGTNGRFGSFTAIEKSTGEVMGWFCFRVEYPLMVEGAIEVGFRMKQAYWGKGYATEMTRALLEYGAGMDIKQICAVAETRHLASRRVLEKAGMVIERDFEEDGIALVRYIVPQ